MTLLGEIGPGREACKLRNAAASTTDAIISAIANAFIVKAPAYKSKT
jgi:hypothetical protein